METVKEFLINPSVAIAKAKKKRDINKVSLLLVLEWFIISLSILLAFSFRSSFLYSLSIAVMFFFVGIPLTLFLALLLKIVVTTLGGKGRYYEALASITYGMLSLSLGIFVSSILFNIPFLGILLGLLTLIASACLTIATFYRAVKELFSLEIFTAWIGIGLVMTGIIIGVYAAYIFLLGGTFTLLPTMTTLGV